VPKFTFRSALDEAVARGVAQPRKQNAILTWSKALEERVDCAIVTGNGLVINLSFHTWAGYILTGSPAAEDLLTLREHFDRKMIEADLPRFLMDARHGKQPHR
jgi:hypothetical protein